MRVRVFLLLGNTGPHASTVADALVASGRIATVGSSSDPVQGVEEATTLAPDVVVVDRFVGLADGLVVARHLHADRPSGGIVLRTPWPDADRHGAERAGVRATVDVAATIDELVRAILDAAVG